MFMGRVTKQNRKMRQWKGHSKTRETPTAFYPLLHYHEEHVCYEGCPDLYFDGVCALSVEVPEWKILFQLFEQGLDHPSFSVDFDDFSKLHVHVVGEQRHELGLLLFHIHISYNSCVVNDVFAVLHFFPLP